MSYLGFCPPGVVLPYAGTVAPEGWLLCDGSEIDQSIYTALYVAIGNTYNTQINSTTGTAWASPTLGNFRVPDYRGIFLRGTGTANGGDSTSLGGHQNQKTAKNGLVTGNSAATVSGLKNQMNGSTGNQSANHTHGIGSDGYGSLPRANDHNWNSQYNAGGVVPIDDSWTTVQTAPSHSHGGGTGGNSVSHSHSWNFGTTATFSASGTATAQAISGDSETRPVNKGINYIIKI